MPTRTASDDTPAPGEPATDGSLSAGGERFQTGDGVLARAPDGQLAPLGRVDAVLHARSGGQIVVERAFQPGRFTPLPSERIAASEYDPTTDLRWHLVDLDAAGVARLPVYRRALGRLTPDPLQIIPPPPGDDAAVTRDLERFLSEDPLVGAADAEVRVVHGVAVLGGWVHTVGAKVAADRLARTTPGIWDVKNRLTSDEELAALARQRVLEDPAAAGAIERIASELGRLTVQVTADARALPEAFVQSLRSLPGCREVTMNT